MNTSQNTPVLTEGELLLRRFTEGDIPALFALYADREINKFLPWFPLETQAQAKADGMPFVTATHDRENPRSGAVMQRLGMRYAYSYTELWQPKNIPVVFRMYQISFDPAAPLYTVYKQKAKQWFVEEPVPAFQTLHNKRDGKALL